MYRSVCCRLATQANKRYCIQVINENVIEIRERIKVKWMVLGHVQLQKQPVLMFLCFQKKSRKGKTDPFYKLICIGSMIWVRQYKSVEFIEFEWWKRQKLLFTRPNACVCGYIFIVRYFCWHLQHHFKWTDACACTLHIYSLHVVKSATNAFAHLVCLARFDFRFGHL